MTTVTEAKPSQPGQRRLLPRWAWFYSPLVLVASAILAFNIFQPITVLPRITLSPGFALKNQEGITITSEDRRGQLTLFSFSYSNCEDCKQTPAQIDAIRTALRERYSANIGLDIATISLDPERDTPQNLGTTIAPSQSDNPIGWEWLTSESNRVRHVIGGGFGLFYKATEPDGDRDYDIRFEPRYVLVDRLGIMRAIYHTATPDVDLLERDINFLLNEEQNSKGVAKIGYEAAHLFLCYPR